MGVGETRAAQHGGDTRDERRRHRRPRARLVALGYAGVILGSWPVGRPDVGVGAAARSAPRRPESHALRVDGEVRVAAREAGVVGGGDADRVGCGRDVRAERVGRVAHGEHNGRAGLVGVLDRARDRGRVERHARAEGPGDRHVVAEAQVDDLRVLGDGPANPGGDVLWKPGGSVKALTRDRGVGRAGLEPGQKACQR